MVKTYFATLRSTVGYKDIITSIKAEEGTPHSEMQRLALQNISKKNSWNMDDMKKYGYTKITFSTEDDKVYNLPMYETTSRLVVIMKNGLPIGTAINQMQAKRVIAQLKADKSNPPGIYKTYEVNEWVSEKTLESGKFRINMKEEQ